MEQCLVPPLEPLKSLVVLEAETDTKCTDQRQCNKADVLNNATKLRERIVERYGGMYAFNNVRLYKLGKVLHEIFRRIC